MALEERVKQFMKDDAKTLARVEKIVDPSCKAVARAKNILLKFSVNNINKAKEIEKNINAHYLTLEEWYERVNALKKNKELAYFIAMKNQAEQEGTKFVSAPTEKEASLYVAPERKLRDKILGNLKGALETMKTCRNIINSQRFETQNSSEDISTED